MLTIEGMREIEVDGSHSNGLLQIRGRLGSREGAKSTVFGFSVLTLMAYTVYLTGQGR